MNRKLRSVVSATVSLALVAAPWSITPAAAASVARPQVVIALGNSQSMDGNLSGAIMTGSGQLSSGLTTLYNSSSPVNYTIPSGFTPPLQAGSGGSAPYTYSSNGTLYDNSPSRLNVAKAGLQSVLSQYLQGMDFALEDYSTGDASLYSTWVYYMSPSGGFTYGSSNTQPGRWVSNPCYQYSSASSTVSSNCASIATSVPGASAIGSYPYMQIAASSDDFNINDVLYTSGAPGVFVDYGGAYAYNAATSTNLGPITSTQTPYTYFSLTDYGNGVINVGYNSAAPGANAGSATRVGPTNAGYVPYSDQVMYAQRGFGYYSTDLSATAGKSVVGMTNLGANPTSSAVATALSPFTTALQPETSSASSSEIKSLAYQSPTAGLVQGAGNVLSQLTPSCAGQYVILVTDGLPTMDLNSKNWPPLGSASGQGFGVKAAFYGVAGQSAYGIVDDSGNVPTGQVTGALDVSKTNDQALIDTINAIKTLASKGIKTYVVGLGAGVDQSANPAAYYALNAMAIAGGTSSEFPANNIQAFTTALGTIASTIYGTAVASAPAVPNYVQNGSLAYVLASDNVSGQQQGFFDAFSTDASGNVSTNPAWQLTMTATQRQTALQTDTGSGTAPITFTSTTAASLGSPTTPSAQTIINYTVDPSYSNGAYLAGRQSGSFLGTITSQADRPVILTHPNNPYFLTNTTYQTYARNNANRASLVMFTANDGFLYAVSAGTATAAGTLQWAWMPSVLLPQLQNYTGFQQSNPMNGGLTTIDSFDGTGWATYVVGTGANGALHYDLKLTSCAASTSSCTPTVSKVWFDNQAGATSPPQAGPQAPAIWWDANGVAYAYYFTTSGSTSYINVMRLYDGSTTKAKVTFTPSSAVNIDVLGGKLFVGDTVGEVWSIDLTSGTTASSLGTPLLLGTAANETGAGPIRYLGRAQTSTGIYLWATTDHEVNVFKFTGGSYSTNTNGWTLWWWSSTSGSGYYSTSSSAMVTTSADPGVTSTTSPYWLDSGGTISDGSAVEAATLIVPVTVAPTTTCGRSTAKYDFFDLAGGTFPKNKFYQLNGAYLTANPVIGLGTAYSPVVSANANGASVIYGASSQNQSGQIGFQVAATSGLHVGPGIMGWQPVWMTGP